MLERCHDHALRVPVSADPGQTDPIWRSAVFLLLMSLGIELLQPFFDRSSDVTDLITNVIGGALGYGLYAIFKPIILWLLKPLKRR